MKTHSNILIRVVVLGILAANICTAVMTYHLYARLEGHTSSAGKIDTAPSSVETAREADRLTMMQNAMTAMEVMRHNIANVNTIGFKKLRVYIGDLTSKNAVRLHRMFNVGSFIQTDNPLDVAIGEQGIAKTFFGITVGDQTLYTRDGTFKISEQGDIVTNDGYQLNPPITGLPPDAKSVMIFNDGNVQYIDANDQVQTLGRLQVYTFINPAGLSAQGSNLFKETDASGQAVQGNPKDPGFGKLLSGFVEYSNVQAVEELVQMIEAQRAYEMNSRTIQTSDEMLQTVNTLKR